MLAETIEQDGYTVEIIYDEDAPSPRENDNAAVLVCFHKRYNLGDHDSHGYKADDFGGWDALAEQIEADHKPVVLLPLYLYDHSGITMRVTPFGDCWDSGQVGLAFVSREKALHEWGSKRVTKHVREMAEKCLRAEVEEYDLFIRGECYGYDIKDANGDSVDSCWGFIGSEACKAEALASVPKKAVA